MDKNAVMCSVYALFNLSSLLCREDIGLVLVVDPPGLGVEE